MKLRRGRHNAYTIYVQWGERPSDHDLFVGAVRTAGFAELLVSIVNTHGGCFTATAWSAAGTDGSTP